MNFPPFWARAKKEDFVCWRWSFKSVAEVEALAAQALEQLMGRIKSGDIPQSTDGGYYPNRPFREQIMREIKNAAWETSAVITRNSYGCLVLNTARAMFVDIDFPEPKKKPGGLFSRLFGKPEITPPGNPASEAIARIENWTRNNSDGAGAFTRRARDCVCWRRRVWWMPIPTSRRVCSRRWGRIRCIENFARPNSVFARG